MDDERLDNLMTILEKLVDSIDGLTGVIYSDIGPLNPNIWELGAEIHHMNQIIKTWEADDREKFLEKRKRLHQRCQKLPAK